MTLLAAGLASGQQTAHAIAQWVQLHGAALRAAIPRLIRLPSESTLLRTVRLMDVAVLEAAIAQVIAPAPPTVAAPSIVTPAGTRLDAYAVDGKALRGVTACGAPTHRVSLIQHSNGTTAAQETVAQKRSEITAMPALLRTAT